MTAWASAHPAVAAWLCAVMFFAACGALWLAGGPAGPGRPGKQPARGVPHDHPGMAASPGRNPPACRGHQEPAAAKVDTPAPGSGQHRKSGCVASLPLGMTTRPCVREPACGQPPSARRLPVARPTPKTSPAGQCRTKPREAVPLPGRGPGRPAMGIPDRREVARAHRRDRAGGRSGITSHGCLTCSAGQVAPRWGITAPGSTWSAWTSSRSPGTRSSSSKPTRDRPAGRVRRDPRLAAVPTVRRHLPGPHPPPPTCSRPSGDGWRLHGQPYVIENIPTAPMPTGLLLCGATSGCRSSGTAGSRSILIRA